MGVSRKDAPRENAEAMVLKTARNPSPVDLRKIKSRAES